MYAIVAFWFPYALLREKHWQTRRHDVNILNTFMLRYLVLLVFTIPFTDLYYSNPLCEVVEAAFVGMDTHTHFPSFSVTHTYTHTHTTDTYTHPHTHTLSLSHSHTHTLTHPHTHILTHTLSLSHTRTHTHTLIRLSPMICAGIFAVLALIAERKCSMKHTDLNKSNSMIGLAVFSLAVGALCQKMDVRKSMCDPLGVVQLHAIWHLLAGAALFLVYIYFSTENIVSKSTHFAID